VLTSLSIFSRLVQEVSGICGAVHRRRYEPVSAGNRTP